MQTIRSSIEAILSHELDDPELLTDPTSSPSRFPIVVLKIVFLLLNLAQLGGGIGSIATEAKGIVAIMGLSGLASLFLQYKTWNEPTLEDFYTKVSVGNILLGLSGYIGGEIYLGLKEEEFGMRLAAYSVVYFVLSLPTPIKQLIGILRPMVAVLGDNPQRIG